MSQLRFFSLKEAYPCLCSCHRHGDVHVQCFIQCLGEAVSRHGGHVTNQNKLRAVAGKGLLGPGADAAFGRLAAPEIRQRVMLAHWVAHSRDKTQQYLGFPLGRIMLQRWMRSKAGSRRIEDDPAGGRVEHTAVDERGTVGRRTAVGLVQTSQAQNLHFHTTDQGVQYGDVAKNIPSPPKIIDRSPPALCTSKSI